MVTETQKAAARKLMEQRGYSNIRFGSDGNVTAFDGKARVLVTNTKDEEFELEWGRYAVIDNQGYESTGFHSKEAAEREAARLSEAIGQDHQVVDALEF